MTGSTQVDESSTTDDEVSRQYGLKRDSQGGGSQRLLSNPVKAITYKDISNLLYERYFWASAVYLAYAIAICYADSIAGDDLLYSNSLYYIFGYVHLIDAILYLISWDSWWIEGIYMSYEVIPDYLNVICSCLYIYSASLYNEFYLNDDDYTVIFSSQFYSAHYAEFAAAVFEFIAALLWIHVSYLTFIESQSVQPPKMATATKGLTLLDPEFHASWSLFVGAVLYLAYSLNTVGDPYSFLTDTLFSKADKLYVFNAVMYMLSCLRDYKLFISIPESTVYDYMKRLFCNIPLQQRNTDRFVYVFGLFCYEKHGLLSTKPQETRRSSTPRVMEMRNIQYSQSGVIANILHNNSEGSSKTKRPTVLQAIMNSTSSESARAERINVATEQADNILI